MDGSTLLGITTGAAIMFGFGIVWLLLGMYRGRPSPSWLRISFVLVGIALGASITTLGSRASGMPLHMAPLTAQQIGVNQQIQLHFYTILGIELAGIFLAVVVLRLIHYPDYILSGIALIVGVHFFPLAALFKQPLFYGTALAGCAIGLVGFFIGDERLRETVVGLSFGVLLWATAACTVWQGLSAPRVIVNRLM